MKQVVRWSCLAMCLPWHGALLVLAEDASQERGGLVVIEVGSQPTTGGWTAVDDHEGFAGASCYRWSGPDSLKEPGQGVLRYPIIVTKAGTYKIFLHNYHNHPTDGTQSNDVFVRIDSGHWWKVFSSSAMRGRWNWMTRQQFPGKHSMDLAYHLSAGLHTLELAGRSEGFHVDRIVLLADPVKLAEATNVNQKPSVVVTVAGEKGLPAQNVYSQIVAKHVKVWQPMTLSFRGPMCEETGSHPNPFLDYRLQVTFQGPTKQVYTVPGYFDGDGEGGDKGNIWRVRFTPDEPGYWQTIAYFRQGPDIAISSDKDFGQPASFGEVRGSIFVGPMDVDAPGFLGKGRLVHERGDYYLRTLGDGRYWLKGGTNSPENFLAYAGFDGTTRNDEPRRITAGSYTFHAYKPHIKDWNDGDPDWGNEQGKGIIGAINYLASRHVNSLHVMPMNIGGDGKDVWPYVGKIKRSGSSENDNRHFDISKLAQWETVFAHAQRKGIHLQVCLNEGERENKEELDNATLGVERKLFYRELVARFGHHNAITWNLCEEYNHTALMIPEEMVCSWAAYLRETDPYDHPITVHGGAEKWDPFFWDPFFKAKTFDAMSFMYAREDSLLGEKTEQLRTLARLVKNPVVINMDELYSTGIAENDAYHFIDHGSWGQYTYGHAFIRRNMVYPVYLSGGNLELILQELLATEDFRKYEKAWDYMYYGRRLLEEHVPFWELEPLDGMLTGESRGVLEDGQVLAKKGEVYLLYLPAGGEATLKIGGRPEHYQQRWYNPRTGQFAGPPTKLTGKRKRADIGPPPSERDQDWAVLIERKDEK